MVSCLLVKFIMDVNERITRVETTIRSMQTNFVPEYPGDDIEDEHMAKHIVYFINKMKKVKGYLFS